MERLDFLRKARQIASEQIKSSSCEGDVDWEIHTKAVAKNKELALYEKARKILEDAASDIEYVIEDMKELK